MVGTSGKSFARLELVIAIALIFPAFTIAPIAAGLPVETDTSPATTAVVAGATPL